MSNILADSLISEDTREVAAERFEVHTSITPGGELDADSFDSFWEQYLLLDLVQKVYENTTAADTHKGIRDVLVETVLHGLWKLKYLWEPLVDVLKNHGDFTPVAFGHHVDAVRKRSVGKNEMVYGFRHHIYLVGFYVRCAKPHIQISTILRLSLYAVDVGWRLNIGI